MEKKICTCEKPEITQALPEGFKGQVTCGKCEGLAEISSDRKKYKGNDSVEEYLFNISQNAQGMTFEKAVLTMALRIEKQLKQITRSEKSK